MIASALKVFVLVPIASVALATIFVGAATSANAADFPVMKVSHAGLDLTTSDGVAKLDQRIRQTARATCRNVYSNLALNGQEARLCVRDLVEMAQMGRTVAIAQAGGTRELASN